MLKPPENVVIDLAGTWHNEHGSEIDLVVDGNRLTGTFRSGTGLAAGNPGNRVVGFASGTLIAFTVDFSAQGSLTSWVGHLLMEDGVPRIHANWSMCVDLPGGAEELWRGIWTGADTFDRGTAEGRPRRAPARQPSHPLPEWP